MGLCVCITLTQNKSMILSLCNWLLNLTIFFPSLNTGMKTYFILFMLGFFSDVIVQYICAVSKILHQCLSLQSRYFNNLDSSYLRNFFSASTINFVKFRWWCSSLGIWCSWIREAVPRLCNWKIMLTANFSAVGSLENMSCFIVYI